MFLPRSQSVAVFPRCLLSPSTAFWFARSCGWYILFVGVLLTVR